MTLEVCPSFLNHERELLFTYFDPYAYSRVESLVHVFNGGSFYSRVVSLSSVVCCLLLVFNR